MCFGCIGFIQVDINAKMITLVHGIKTHVLDVKVSNEFIAVVSNVMKHHFSVYSIFAKDINAYRILLYIKLNLI